MAEVYLGEFARPGTARRVFGKAACRSQLAPFISKTRACLVTSVDPGPAGQAPHVGPCCLQKCSLAKRSFCSFQVPGLFRALQRGDARHHTAGVLVPRFVACQLPLNNCSLTPKGSTRRCLVELTASESLRSSATKGQVMECLLEVRPVLLPLRGRNRGRHDLLRRRVQSRHFWRCLCSPCDGQLTRAIKRLGFFRLRLEG